MVCIKMIFPPNKLKNYKGVLLILVRESSAEILLQVEEYRNPEIYCITWNEIVASYMLFKKGF